MNELLAQHVLELEDTGAYTKIKHLNYRGSIVTYNNNGLILFCSICRKALRYDYQGYSRYNLINHDQLCTAGNSCFCCSIHREVCVQLNILIIT